MSDGSGGKAMAALLSGEIAALSARFSEAVDLACEGDVKIIGVTSETRIDAAPDAMTMKERGIETTFVNWRGFFGAPCPPGKQDRYVSGRACQDVWHARVGRSAWPQWLSQHPQFGR